MFFSFWDPGWRNRLNTGLVTFQKDRNSREVGEDTWNLLKPLLTLRSTHNPEGKVSNVAKSKVSGVGGKWLRWLFPGGSAVKNPPGNAGGTGSIPDPGRAHMPWSNEPHEPQLLSPSSRAQGPHLLKPMCPTACALEQEKPPRWEANSLQLESSSRLPQLKESPRSHQDSAQPKVNK